MASRVLDANALYPSASAGAAATDRTVIAAILGALNGTIGADANWAIQALTGAAAITPTKRVVTIAVTGATAYTLADGAYLGDEVLVVCLAPGSAPVGTVTPATRAAGYSNVTAFGVQGDFCQFIWTSTGWMYGANGGVTITP